MSVIITVKFQGDVAKFRQALTDHADQFAKIGEQGRASGAIHHRFAVGDGFVIAVDEWQSVEHFQKFFANPDLQALVAMAGASPQQPPEVTVAQAISTSDQF
jgi:quinol monooxygenase YgiN